MQTTVVFTYRRLLNKKCYCLSDYDGEDAEYYYEEPGTAFVETRELVNNGHFFNVSSMDELVLVKITTEYPTELR